MVRSHAGVSRLDALASMSRGGNAFLFDGYRGFRAYTPCDFQIASQTFARVGCSELSVVLQQLEQVVCEASKVQRLNTADARWTSAINILESESGIWSRSAVVFPGNCAQYVEFTNAQIANVQALMAEAGQPSKLAPPKIKGSAAGTLGSIPTSFIIAGGVVLGLAALYYAGPVIRGYAKRRASSGGSAGGTSSGARALESAKRKGRQVYERARKLIAPK